MANTRRNFLQCCAAGLSSALLPLKAASQEARPTNVIVILSDDQGSVDVNCYGATDLHTPHLDALAGRGLRFTQFYVGAPVCSPSRAALLTGSTPQRAGLANNAGGDRGLPANRVTIAEMLKSRGYATGLFGKWHLGELPEMLPNAQGFDEFFGFKNGCIDNYSHFFYWSGPNRHDLWRNGDETFEDGQYFPEMIVQESKNFMREHREKPFFLYLPFNIPHYPIQPLQKFRDLYKDLPEPRRNYAALVSTLDEQVGEIVAEVDALGLRENTLIVFLSDHGHSVEERTFFGGGSSGPFRGHKFTVWEGGIRVPCIVSMPGTLPEGEVRDQPCSSIDLLPTIAALCGAGAPEAIDGISILPTLRDNAPVPDRVLHWQLRDHWAVRKGDWKLVANADKAENIQSDPPADPVMLIKLSDDPGEANNLAAEFPYMVLCLQELHAAWVRETGSAGGNS